MLSYRNNLLLFIFLILSFVVHAQQTGGTTFEASMNVSKIALGDYFEITFTMVNGEAREFRPPDFRRNFNVLSGPNKGMKTVAVNGQWSTTLSYSFTLQPKKEGRIRISSASMVSNGKTYKSQPLMVEVVKKTAGGNTGIAIDEDGDAFIRAEVTTVEAVTGQQILLDYKSYTVRSLEKTMLINESEYEGFYAQEIRNYNGRVMQEVVEDKTYYTQILKRVALFPQQTGQLEIEPMRLEVAIAKTNQPPNTRRSLFYRPQVDRMTLETKPVRINVKSLPPGAPASFSGAIGDYAGIMSIDRNKLSTDDAITIRLGINGTGDVKRIRPPVFELSDTFEVYEPKVLEEKSQESQGLILGRKTFEYLILPKIPGNYKLDPAFTYYDTDSMAYVTIDTSFLVSVTKGTQGGNSIVNKSTSITLADEDIRFIQQETTLRKSRKPFLGSGFFWTILSLPFLTLMGLMVFKKVQTEKANVDVTQVKRKGAEKVAHQKLAIAKTHMINNEPRPFYDEISKACFGYLSDKVNMPYSELSKANVKDKLESLNVAAEDVNAFVGILNTCEMALFAGMDNSAGMTDTYEKTVRVITSIEKTI